MNLTPMLFLTGLDAPFCVFTVPVILIFCFLRVIGSWLLTIGFLVLDPGRLFSIPILDFFVTFFVMASICLERFLAF